MRIISRNSALTNERSGSIKQQHFLSVTFHSNDKNTNYYGKWERNSCSSLSSIIALSKPPYTKLENWLLGEINSSNRGDRIVLGGDKGVWLLNMIAKRNQLFQGESREEEKVKTLLKSHDEVLRVCIIFAFLVMYKVEHVWQHFAPRSIDIIYVWWQ